MQRQFKATCCFLTLLVLGLLVAILRIVQDCNVGQRWHEFLEQLKPLPCEFRRNASQPGRLATGSRYAGDKAVERVTRQHNDGYRSRCIFGRPQPLIAGDDHHVHIEPGKLARELWEQIWITFRRFSYDGDVLVLEITQVMETLEKCLVIWRRQGRIYEHTDARQLRLIVSTNLLACSTG